MIKLDEVHSIEADYQMLEISFFNQHDRPIYTIKCLSTFELLEKFQELTRNFIKSINGHKIIVHLPTAPKPPTSPTKYKGGSLFMDFSSTERI